MRLRAAEMIDLHTHILPGLDDGARSLEESLRMLEEMTAEGVTTVVATPHVRADYPTTPGQLGSALALVRQAVAASGGSISVEPGGEIALPFLDTAGPERLAAFGLGGNERLLLLEFPYGVWPTLIEARIARLRQQGVVPLLAHPERNPLVIENPARLRSLVEAGALCQVTAGSLLGSFGRDVARCGRKVVELGLAQVIASDVHRPGTPRASLGRAAATVGEPLATWLTVDVPRALLDGHDLPRRPRRGRGRGWWAGWRR